MSLNSVFAAAVVLLQAANGASAQLTVCPQTHNDGRKTGKLENASVYDGPPEMLVDLMPDLETATWDISLAQSDVRQRGVSMYLVCRYTRIETPVTLKIHPDASYCKVDGIKGVTRAYCDKTPLKAHATSH